MWRGSELLRGIVDRHLIAECVCTPPIGGINVSHHQIWPQKDAYLVGEFTGERKLGWSASSCGVKISEGRQSEVLFHWSSNRANTFDESSLISALSGLGFFTTYETRDGLIHGWNMFRDVYDQQISIFIDWIAHLIVSL